MWHIESQTFSRHARHAAHPRRQCQPARCRRPFGWQAVRPSWQRDRRPVRRVYRCEGLNGWNVKPYDFLNFLFLIRLRICQQHTQKRLTRLSCDHFIGLCGFGDVKAMGDQRPDIQLALRHQIDDRFEIASFGPADKADRIVVAVFLIVRVIAARPIGARIDKGDFLFEIDSCVERSGQLRRWQPLGRGHERWLPPARPDRWRRYRRR